MTRLHAAISGVVVVAGVVLAAGITASLVNAHGGRQPITIAETPSFTVSRGADVGSYAASIVTDTATGQRVLVLHNTTGSIAAVALPPIPAAPVEKAGKP